jgi:general stress protein YciG
MSNTSTPENPPAKPLRGFAAMTADQRRALGSKGGRTAHERGTANKWTSDEARAAGRKGGSAARRSRSSYEPSES